MIKFINLKEDAGNVDYALKLVEIEIDNAKREGVICLKILHGYGSHGKGGAMASALRIQLAQWKKSKFIVDYFGGDKWNLFDNSTQKILMHDKTIYNDEDMNKGNPGITIIQVSEKNPVL